MTIVGEAIVVWTATGLTVLAMKWAEGKGHYFPSYLPKVCLYGTLSGSIIHLLNLLPKLFL